MDMRFKQERETTTRGQVGHSTNPEVCRVQHNVIPSISTNHTAISGPIRQHVPARNNPPFSSSHLPGNLRSSTAF